MVDTQTQRQMPSSAGRDDDLYAQIAAGDAAEIVQPKHKGSFIMDFMVWYMRLTLTIDEKRREYANIFRIMNRVWNILMGGLYLCGVIVFCILVVSYLRFPTYIKDYLAKNNVLCDDIKIPYIISQVDLYGLHDKENTYHIEKLSLYSTFSDFLNRRAKNVAVNGVQITLEDDFKKTQNLLKVLSDLNGMTRTSKGLKVDSLDVSRAMLSVKGKNYELPVSFTMTGLYGKETNIVATISVDQSYLKAQGNLSITNTPSGTTWNLDIPYGTVVLPGRSGEAMSLTLSVVTNDNQIQKIAGNAELTLNQIKKKFTVSMDEQKGKGYAGSVNLNWSDVTDPQKPINKTDIAMALTGVNVDKDGLIQTKRPIQLDMTTAYDTRVKVQKLSALLTGDLTCKLSDRCTYHLTKEARTKIQKLHIPFFQTELDNSKPVNFSLLPSQNTFVFIPKQGLLSVNLNTSNFQLVEDNTQSNVKKTLTLPKASLVGQMNVLSQEMSWMLGLQDAKFDDNVRSLSGANLLISNVMQPMSDLTLSIESLSFKDNPLLKVPVKLTYLSKEGKSYADVSLKSYPIRVLFEGYYDASNELLEGTVLLPTTDLAGIKKQGFAISSLFPKDLILNSGKVGAYGHVSGRMGSLKGPIQLALSNVALQKGNLELTGLNTNLILKDIYPLETEDEQHIFVDQVQSVVPLTNVDLTVKLAPQYAQVEKISAQLLNLPLYGVETIIPYHDVGTLLYLRNKTNDLTAFVKQLKVPNWTLSGHVSGSLLFPLSIRDLELGVKNASAQFANLTLNYTGPDKGKPVFLGSDRQIHVQAGSVAIENAENKKLKVAVGLEGKLEPSQAKKDIRETLNYTESIWPIISQSESRLPSEIEYAIQDTLKKTEITNIK